MMSSNRRGKKANISSYGAWADMIQRCTNPNLQYYHRYGGRGIKVCDEWRQFDNFYSDMGEKPKGMSLGRKDNDGDYTPDNCQWETSEQQDNNKVTSRYLEYQGRRLTIAQWARQSTLSPVTFRTRLNRGWTLEEVLNTPAFKNGGHR